MKKKFLGVLSFVLVFLMVMAGCQNTSKDTATESGLDGGTDANAKSAILIVTGQLGDKSFNDSANRGMTMLSEMGWETKVIEIGRDQSKWEPAFMDIAEEANYELIFTNGSNAAEIVYAVAEEFPEQKFVLYDTEMEEGLHPNVYTIGYKQNEGSYLAGVVAALVSTSDMEHANEEKLIGFIGGMEHPIITDFLVGYIEGAKSVVPDIKVIVSYIGSWDDTAKGKEVALAQFAQGVDITFPAAEQAGLGCIEAAKEHGAYIIGVDSDQAMLFAGVDEDAANTILTSVLKNVDYSIKRAGEKFEDGSLTFGASETLGIIENGAGIAENEYYEKNVPQDIRDKVEEAKKEVTSGAVSITSALNTDSDTVEEILASVKP